MDKMGSTTLKSMNNYLKILANFYFSYEQKKQKEEK